MNPADDTGRWPNFLVIGAAKAGTTALYNHLRRHPDIYMSPVKEPAFFAHEGDPMDYRGPGDETLKSGRVATTVEEYRKHFEEVGDETAIGEASVVYLYSADAPPRIHHYIPDAKLVAILRDPVERAYSNYLDNRRHGLEPITNFKEAIEKEKARAEAGWGWYWRYVDIGFYGRQLERYLEWFDRDQIRMYLYEDYISDPRSLLSDLFDFLGVDDSLVPDLGRRYNVSRFPRSQLFESLLTRPSSLKSAVKLLASENLRERIVRSRLFHLLRGKRPRIPLDAANQLLETYRDDILRLQDLMERDLSAWLEGSHGR